MSDSMLGYVPKEWTRLERMASTRCCSQKTSNSSVLDDAVIASPPSSLLNSLLRIAVMK